jgi:hypothetical protein
MFFLDDPCLTSVLAYRHDPQTQTQLSTVTGPGLGGVGSGSGGGSKSRRRVGRVHPHLILTDHNKVQQESEWFQLAPRCCYK